jgi:hypothetical protein
MLSDIIHPTVEKIMVMLSILYTQTPAALYLAIESE